jgi:hypothetical protein
MSGQTAQERYAALVKEFLGHANVTYDPSATKGFGSSALKTNGKIFAMLDSKGKFVVKLPRQQVDALVAAGQGERFDPGHGRLMKEWLAVDPVSEVEWLSLAKDALEYVASKG